jgi:hypothetical protein
MLKRLTLFVLLLLPLVASAQGPQGGTIGAGGGVSPNSPIPANQVGPGFNVKNYGAKGDTKQSANATGQAPGLTCTDCNFTSADVGKGISCGQNGTSIVNGVTTTIASVVSATSVTINPASRDGNGGCVVNWGTIDDTAVQAAITAFVAAANATANPNAIVNSPTLYFPAGRYYLTQPFVFQLSGPGAIKGDAGGTNVSPSQLLFANKTTGTNALFYSSGSTLNIQDLLLDGAQGNFTTGFTTAMLLNGGAIVDRVQVRNFGNQSGIESQGLFDGFRVSTQNNATTGFGFACVACSGEVREINSGNNLGAAENVLIQQVAGGSANEGFRVFGGLVDEGAACGLSVVASSDVWLIGPSIYGSGSTHPALCIDGNSFVHFDGGLAGTFAVDIQNNGATIAAGGTLQSADVRYISTGTSKCITNSGQFNDNGGNSCESLFGIASGTSTGTTAVLTLTTLGANVNTNCSVGDSLIVQNAAINGYNGYFKGGITAVTATTLTYLTQGSNLGALGSGGQAYCRNLQTYSGTLPTALLNNPVPNTCYITGTFAATTTAAPMCNFFLGTATNITHIKASSTTTTACTVAPVVTISDGTVSQTLTITTAKSVWDSSVDASTGVGTTIFKPNGTITLSNTVGTCTTPPTNFSVSYNVSPILSN